MCNEESGNYCTKLQSRFISVLLLPRGDPTELLIKKIDNSRHLQTEVTARGVNHIKRLWQACLELSQHWHQTAEAQVVVNMKQGQASNPHPTEGKFKKHIAVVCVYAFPKY